MLRLSAALSLLCLALCVTVRPISAQSEIPFGGGDGGDQIGYSRCPSGYAAIGYAVKSGFHLDSIAAVCGSLKADFSLGPQTVVAGIAGGPGGDIERVAQCNRGGVLQGLTGKTGRYVNEIVGLCSTPSEVAANNPTPGTWETDNRIRFEDGGAPAGNRTCSPGAVITGFKVRYGQWTDFLWLICSPIKQTAGVMEESDYPR